MPSLEQSAAVIRLGEVVVERVEGERVFRLQIEKFEVGAGELVAVVGPSGSGKSTLLDLLGLILPPREHGCFVVGGEEVVMRQGRIVGAALRRRKIGFVLQHGALLPFLNVRDNIYLGAGLAGISLDRLEVEDLLARLGLFDLQEAMPAKISGGQRQRVALARALAMKPPLLLADEPTGSVDANQALEIGRLLREMTHELGLATVLVTHDQGLAGESADRTVRIEPGFPHPGLTHSRFVQS
jgi:putative ABC transport system ATP-binding protein